MHLDPHQVETVYERGWSSLKNGELLIQAEASGFDVLVTTDQNLKYQQNLSSRRIAIVLMTTTSWPRIQRSLGSVVKAVESAAIGSYIEIAIASGS
jgi:hypothetical protein